MSHLPEFVPSEFQNIWIDNQSSEEYHKDKTAIGSSSIRKILKSPATFLHGLTDTTPRKESEAFKLGSAFHMALLEPNKFALNYVREPEFGDLRSPKNRTSRDAWLSEQSPQATTLSEKDYIRLEGMINSVSRHRDASSLLKQGMAEVSGYYRDPSTGLKCKIKPDFLNLDLMSLLDVKTTDSCVYEDFSKSMAAWRYDFQIAMYAEGVKLITGKNVNYSLFLAVEKTPPYEVALYAAEENVLSKGLEDYQKALTLLAYCLQNESWPSYQMCIQTIGLPAWALNKI